VLAGLIRIKFIPIDSADDIAQLVAFSRVDQVAKPKELSMIPSTMRSMSAEPLLKREAIADGGDLGPMPQQDAGDCHGHEMHPQKLVRLVGCHDPQAETTRK
jgi:hypothetical protein